MDRVLEGIVHALILISAGGFTLWTAGAIYFDFANGAKWGRWLALGWVAGVVALFVVWQPLWQPFVALCGILAVFLAWWFRQKPSHDRDWDPAVAVLPKAFRKGDEVTIENVRNFEYRTLNDFTPRYEARTYHLANLRGADIIFFNWGSAVMSHPVLVFDFGPDGRVCLSIEVRYRRGQEYLILRSLYHFYELIFLVADERDVILRRTKFSPSEEALLYRLNVDVEELRTTFLDYVNAINALYQTPQWYNGLCANCTTSFYHMPGQQLPCDWRVLANARLDRALYDNGRLDRNLPFPELRRAAYLTDIANAAPAEGFGDYIRRELDQRRQTAAK
jgi:hypothetical protein